MRFVWLTLVLLLGAALAHAAGVLDAGAPFPGWKLLDHTGAAVSSGDLAGKRYLLWFYPKASTPGCTMEGDGLRDKFAELQRAGIEVLGVSFDEPAENRRFVQERGFPFRLLSDAGRTLAVAVGAADSVEQPVARRISYLVGADGTVERVYGTVNPATHAGDVLSDLSAPAR